MPDTAQSLIIIVGGSDQLYREYSHEWIAAAYSIAVITAEPPTWQRRLIVDHEVADTRDSDSVRAAGRSLALRHRIAGVLTWDEFALIPTAALAADLGLSGNSISSMSASRDKATSRRKFAENGVPSAKSTPTDSLAAAAAAADHTGYPIVLKPASYAGAIGVIRVDAAEDLPAAWSFSTAGATGQGREGSGVLVEEYLAGPEISVECATIEGRTTALAVVRKELGFAPYFEELGHAVTAADPLLPEVAPVAAAAVQALGVREGVQHVEMRLTATGPRIIEVNSRIAGDLIGVLVRLATGLDLPRIAADIACGRTPELIPSEQQSAAIRMLYPTHSGILTAREVSGAPAAEYPWLERICWERPVGDNVILPPEGNVETARIGFMIVSADSQAQAYERLDLIEKRLVLRVSREQDRDSESDQSVVAQ
ncbi:ATP-grasp domain-containing protein [Nocardia sp. NPDC049220]|uniref:ATP-grasp domain-containing protein n=1 Tax=Nocardia sp. NPDC049220 TaxID=3155273 RepID=UPI0033F79189